MNTIVKIDDETITADELIKILKFSGRYEAIVEDIVKEKLAAHAAQRQGLSVSPEEVQERADQLRRVRGLHRAKETLAWLDALGITVDDFERFITEALYYQKMMNQVTGDSAVEDYFRSNSPKFDSLEVSHIVVDSEGKAKELMALLKEDPDSFADMVQAHSVTDTKAQGGRIGKVIRGALNPDIEVKLFNAAPGDLIGPFAVGDSGLYEIFRIDAKTPARLDEETKATVRRLVSQAWFAARAKEHIIQAH